MITKHEYLEENEFATVLNTDVKFKGKVETQEPNLIKGQITEGKIKATLLVVVKEGMVSGTIESDMLSVLGKCKGELRINDTLTLLKEGQIEGKVRTKNLIVGEGGILNGECNMNTHKEE